MYRKAFLHTALGVALGLAGVFGSVSAFAQTQHDGSASKPLRVILVPADGVYTFHAPREWQYPDNEPGYDLRIEVHGKPWRPATRRHAHGDWSIALQRGAHPFRITFIDMRPTKPKPELWNNFPNPDVVWKGVTPTLEISGPGFPRAALPEPWLRHTP